MLKPILTIEIVNLIFKYKLICCLNDTLMIFLKEFTMLIHYLFSVIKEIKIYCEICNSHGREHEDHLILKCDAMWFDRWVPL